MHGIVGHSLTQQRLERVCVYLVSLTDVYRPSLVPAEAGVEEIIGVGELGPMEEREFTLSLKALAFAYIPSCDQTGVPLHFQSSTTSRSTSWMILRISASHSPLQSPRSAIISPIFPDALNWSEDSVAALRGCAAFEDLLDGLPDIPSI